MIFLKFIAQIILLLGKWKIKGGLYPGVNKAVMVFAPHTSNWDGVYGLAVLISRNVPIKFLVKKELMFFPLGLFLKKLGAISVDRKNVIQSGKLVDKLVKIFHKEEKMFLLIEPEGTRGKNRPWKTGFYRIAKEAKVPVIITYLDYQKREGVFGNLCYLTDNEEKDIVKIKEFYANVKGKNS